MAICDDQAMDVNSSGSPGVLAAVGD